jgi:hypothetical protein
MERPPTCACGIYLCIPHEHAQGLPKIGAPYLTLADVGGLDGADKLIILGLLAKVGEGLYKVTERGHRENEAAALRATRPGQE